MSIIILGYVVLLKHLSCKAAIVTSVFESVGSFNALIKGVLHICFLTNTPRTNLQMIERITELNCYKRRFGSTGNVQQLLGKAHT